MLAPRKALLLAAHCVARPKLPSLSFGNNARRVDLINAIFHEDCFNWAPYICAFIY